MRGRTGREKVKIVSDYSLRAQMLHLSRGLVSGLCRVAAFYLSISIGKGLFYPRRI